MRWLALLLCFPSLAFALTCTTTTANLTASTVQTALNNAASGDIVCLPTGSVSWGADAVTFPSDADVTLAGSAGVEIVSCSGTAGASDYACTESGTVTAITCTAGDGATCIWLDISRSPRLTGIRFSMSGDWAIRTTGNQAVGKHFRIDHNRIISTAGWQIVLINGGTSGGNARGILDHNRFEGGLAVHVVGTTDGLDDSNHQHVIWAEEPTWGGGEAITYIEANFFINESSSTTNFGDGNYAARSVIRFNTYSGPATSGLEFHSVQGENRSYQHWEVYKNHIKDIDSTDGCFWGPLFIRGGTGVAWGNDTSGAISGCAYTYVFDNVRSDIDENLPSIPFDCDGSGTTGWDENTTGEHGWHCRDQIGISHDNVQWEDSPATAWNQSLKPAMAWENRVGGTLDPFEVNVNEWNPTHIQANRDYYDHSTATGSPQTVGIRSNTIANRPSGCTAGVGYWATDEGEWNSLSGGNDGRLYKCTATDTWTLYYTPYTYPHPWTDDGGALDPPTNFRLISWLLSGGILILGGLIGGKSFARTRAASAAAAIKHGAGSLAREVRRLARRAA